MSNKPKPATDGEKVEMALLRRCRDAHPPTLEEFRSLSEFCGERAAARAHDRAIARAVKTDHRALHRRLAESAERAAAQASADLSVLVHDMAVVGINQWLIANHYRTISARASKTDNIPHPERTP